MDIRPGTTLEGPDGKAVTIESLVGSGGFGQVYSGRLEDGTRVAVKTVLTGSLDDSALLTLQNEAKHAVGVNHPNVVRVLYVNDGEKASGRPPYLVMEYVEGGTLADAIARQKAAGTHFAVDELRAMYLQIAEGMAAVNARLVHRDLKPANVLLDAGGLLKISDFGLSKLVDAATRSETFKGWGTRPYQAPEAFEGGANTPAMDVYAGGVVFFEMAALTWPIEPKAGDNSPLGWRNAHLLTAPKDIRAVRPDLPQDLVQLIVRMLQKDPAKRPASWKAVVERLQKNNAGPGHPDVTALVSKATSTLIQSTAAEARAREEQEREQERTAVLEREFGEPVEALRSLVEAFNAESAVGQLDLRVARPLEFEVRTNSGQSRLLLSGQIVPDIDLGSNGIVRIMALARLEPTPKPRSSDDMYGNRESFGSFNLVYRVPKRADRFGRWSQFRFEISPLMGQMSYPRWFGIGLHELPRELQVLNAVGVHQHEQRSLDDQWFKMLLVQML